MPQNKTGTASNKAETHRHITMARPASNTEKITTATLANSGEMDSNRTMPRAAAFGSMNLPAAENTKIVEMNSFTPRVILSKLNL